MLHPFLSWPAGLVAKINFHGPRAKHMRTRCWVWTGGLNNKGYGRCHYRRKQVLVHRLAYETALGPIPKEMTIDHLCVNRSCCRPSHLEPVTNGENIRRGYARLRAQGIVIDNGAHNAAKTHCPHGHEYTPDNTYYNGGSNGNSRCCKQCNRDRAAANRARKRS